VHDSQVMDELIEGHEQAEQKNIYNFLEGKDKLVIPKAIFDGATTFDFKSANL